MNVESKVSIVCTLQNLTRSGRSPGYFLPNLVKSDILHILFFAYYIVGKNAILDEAIV